MSEEAERAATAESGTTDAAALQARVAELEKQVAELDNLWRRAGRA